MKLTRRQEEFLRNLLDLYHEAQEPLHYSALAERLGVSRFTAYDMLRLLEEKGLATSTYRLAEDKSGPGRSEVVYVPTPQAHRMMAELVAEVGGDDWEAAKERILEKVQEEEEEGEHPGRDVAAEMLARIPSEEPGSVRYCLEVITIIALYMRRHHGRALLMQYLPKILSPSEEACRANLSLLSGFALGVLVDEIRDERWGEELLEHVRAYQTMLIDMEPALCRRLADRVRDVFAPLGEL